MNGFAHGLLLAVGVGLAGCQSVNTTQGGVVGVERKQYMFSLLSSEELNQQYAQSYQQTVHQAASGGKLERGTADAERLQRIADRLIAHVPVFRPDAADWEWQVNLIDSPELNANCGPGGKIIFYSGLIERLKLTDAEIAAVMGHEIAHALREHGREAMSKAYGVKMASFVGSALGYGDAMQVANVGVEYLMTLPNSRDNEREADLIGLELAARGGYDPRASISLWEKMSQAGSGTQPEFMSTHPAPGSRIEGLQAAMPKVLPLYQQSAR